MRVAGTLHKDRSDQKSFGVLKLREKLPRPVFSALAIVVNCVALIHLLVTHSGHSSWDYGHRHADLAKETTNIDSVSRQATNEGETLRNASTL